MITETVVSTFVFHCDQHKIIEQPSSLAAAEANYRRLVKIYHPDQSDTGDRDIYEALQAAILEARRVMK